MDTTAHRLLSQIPCQYLKGVGPKLAKLLEKCGILTIQDILFYLPYRYQDRTRITPIRQARPGDWVVIEGKITDVQITRRPRKPSQFTYIISDNSGSIYLRFFHMTQQQQDQLENGTLIRAFGEIKYGTKGYNLIHPEYQINNNLPPEKNLTPIYSTTEGLTQYHWRKMTDQALLILNPHNVQDFLSDQDILLHDAIRFVHRPDANTNIELLENRQHPAQVRLAFEELLAHHLSLRQKRQKLLLNVSPIFKSNKDLENKFLAQLKFKLTKAQARVIKEIQADLSKPHPMMRLVQGDVGSGKTVVAALAALTALENNHQVALMAPTELLAEQHFANFSKWFGDFNITVLLFRGKATAKNKQANLEALKNNPKIIAIGTHALFQDTVEYNKLGLIIIDEQHRFGVEQRLALQKKGSFPHQLVMTATPIPRTLAMTFYADLETSIIDELPPGRTPIKTVLINHSRRDEIIERIKKAHHEKRQIYWVCPLIEESDVLQYRAAQTTEELLKKSLPELNIKLIHGKIKNSEKEKIMAEFKSGKIDLLVATTVIEVGVDVPNASVMIIENPERLGLAQLHQLRGRVGRGSKESHCILLFQEPLSHLAQERLKVMRESQDGFVIAEKDLELRGPGELLGTRQTGDIQMRVADLQRDKHLFNQIQKTADELLVKNSPVIPLIIQRWLGNVERFTRV
ncbi:MAG: ATP-dependent DNA helicase RecG [Gammaproteobacteria bacterium]|nr:ATP-dependent DNA helicase RecG [Gammaproteobacteria bacterium]